MSFDYKPDTPKEYAFIGSSFARLGTAMSGVLLFEANKWWVLGSLLLTWLGHEVHAYFKMQDGESIQDNKPEQNQ